MSDKSLTTRSLRLRALLQQIADSEGRILESTRDLQEFVEELTERGIITREEEHFRIRWGIAPTGM